MELSNPRLNVTVRLRDGRKLLENRLTIRGRDVLGDIDLCDDPGAVTALQLCVRLITKRAVLGIICEHGP